MPDTFLTDNLNGNSMKFVMQTVQGNGIQLNNVYIDTFLKKKITMF